MAAAKPEYVSQLQLVSGFLHMKLSSDVKLIDRKENLNDLVEKLKSSKLFAFDCESVEMGRNHPISLMNFAFQDGSIYLVDVQKLGLTDELRSILSDPGIKKVMFYCRADADCLKHQYQVILDGVIDMQLMEYVIRHRNFEVAYELPTFHELIAKYLNIGSEKYLMDLNPKEDRGGWGVRPLKQSLLKYASFGISCFLPVKAALTKLWCHDEGLIENWSRNYASSRRDESSLERTYPYKSHHLMPPFIINKPGFSNKEQGHSFSCTVCSFKLPSSEFSKNQLKKSVHKCKMCIAMEVQIPKPKKKRRGKTGDSVVRYIYVSDDEDDDDDMSDMDHDLEATCSTKVRHIKKKAQKGMDYSPEFNRDVRNHKRKNWRREDKYD